MSTLKSEIKIGTAHEIGCRLDDFLDSASKEIQKIEGSISAFKRAVTVVDEAVRQVDREMDAGEFGIEEATLVKKYVLKLKATFENLANQSEGNRIGQVGKVQALQAAVLITKQYKDVEEAKLNSIRAAARDEVPQPEIPQNEVEKSAVATPTDAPVAAPVVVEEEEKPRQVGSRPKPSLKERRLSVEAKKRVGTKSDA
jgi:hypothetical protein